MELELANGGTALIDAEDYDLVRERKWYNAPTSPYVRSQLQRKTIYLHRVILDAPAGVEVDHKNGNPLDNRKCNLRLVTRSQNEQAKKARTNTITGSRNVYYCADKKNKPFRVLIMLNQKNIHLGYFDTVEEAALVAEQGRQKYFTHQIEVAA
jgi:hypothetical protein